MKNPIPKKQSDKFTPFIYPIKVKHKLERPPLRTSKDFLDVVMTRRSVRNFMQLSIKEVAELLYWSTRIQATQLDETGFVQTKRTSPSSGGRHPIDLLVSPSLISEKRKLSYYNPVDHTLGEIITQENKLDEFFNEVSQNLPIQNACIIWFAIHTAKTSSKYVNPESLYWKDTGALLYCIQLIATFLNFKSCALGTLAASSFHNILGREDIVSGGGILIGK